MATLGYYSALLEEGSTGDECALTCTTRFVCQMECQLPVGCSIARIAVCSLSLLRETSGDSPIVSIVRLSSTVFAQLWLLGL